MFLVCLSLGKSAIDFGDVLLYFKYHLLLRCTIIQCTILTYISKVLHLLFRSLYNDTKTGGSPYFLTQSFVCINCRDAVKFYWISECWFNWHHLFCVSNNPKSSCASKNEKFHNVCLHYVIITYLGRLRVSLWFHQLSLECNIKSQNHKNLRIFQCSFEWRFKKKIQQGILYVQHHK